MSWRRWLAVLGAIPIVSAVGVSAAWGVDGWVHSDRVARNVVLDGVAVGGMTWAELDAHLDAVRLRYETADLEVRLPGATMTSAAAAAGVRVDVAATAEAVRNVGMGPVVDRFSSWLGSYRLAREVDLRFEVDPGQVATFVANHPDHIHSEPVEPSFAAVDGRLIVQPPVTGKYLDPSRLVAALFDAVEAGPPFVAEVAWSDRAPRLDEGDLTVALGEADDLIRQVTVRVGEQPARIGAETIRRWVYSEQSPAGKLTATIDTIAAQEYLERRFAELATPGTLPTFTVVEGEVEYELGEPAMTCCEAETGELFRDALRNGARTIDLPMRLVDEDGGVAAAEAIGITQVVGEFTTSHACCRSRVRNIQNIADLVRGQLIMPGESFSINEFVGRRTRDKGFVAAGVIQNGHFVEDVGGGISQFATTMFNAAFFAGLELDEYQSHSIYISRYPYGREATMSFPQPDLRITNPTPYGVLIWTSYTDTSITVQMYSSPYFTTEQTGQRSFKVGACTRVNTYRERTAPDGNVLEDFVYATYRPGEGLDCNGNRTTKPRT